MTVTRSNVFFFPTKLNNIMLISIKMRSSIEKLFVVCFIALFLSSLLGVLPNPAILVFGAEQEVDELIFWNYLLRMTLLFLLGSLVSLHHCLFFIF